MKLSYLLSSERSVRKRSKLHHGTATEGVDNSKSKNGLKISNATPTDSATDPQSIIGKGEYLRQTSTVPETTWGDPETHAQKQLARDGYSPTLDPFAQTPVLPARFPETTSLVCNEDNVLRDMLRHPDSAHTFCPLWLGPRIDGHRLATFMGTEDPVAVSSACTCFESKLNTGCCTLTDTTGDPFVKSLVQSILDNSAALGPVSTSSSRNPATEDATFARPTEHWGPMTAEATVTAVWQGPTSVPRPSMSPNSHQTFTLTNAPLTLASSTGIARGSSSAAAAVYGDVKTWLGGGEVLAPEVVAAVVCLFLTLAPCNPISSLHHTMAEYSIYLVSEVSGDPYVKRRDTHYQLSSLAASNNSNPLIMGHG
ncbi:MAG: hypothetical protein Q9213_001033 [Squamulea squamosa]